MSPAKHSYARLPRKCDYRTDRRMGGQTDASQSDPYVPLCFAGDTKMKCLKLYALHCNIYKMREILCTSAHIVILIDDIQR